MTFERYPKALLTSLTTQGKPWGVVPRYPRSYFAADLVPIHSCPFVANFKGMKPLIRKFSLLAALLGIALLAACEHTDVPSLQSGKPCTIQFRRDALGAGANLPISPMVGGVNGAETSISGTLKRCTAEWVLIEKSGDEIWVPKSVVLLIQQRAQ